MFVPFEFIDPFRITVPRCFMLRQIPEHFILQNHVSLRGIWLKSFRVVFVTRNGV